MSNKLTNGLFYLLICASISLTACSRHDAGTADSPPSTEVSINVPSSDSKLIGIWQNPNCNKKFDTIQITKINNDTLKLSYKFFDPMNGKIGSSLYTLKIIDDKTASVNEIPQGLMKAQLITPDELFIPFNGCSREGNYKRVSQ